MSDSQMNTKMIFLILALICSLILFGCTQTDAGQGVFAKVDGSVCKENNKPIIRMFSTTTCPHCLWVKDTFDSVAKKYVDEGKIVAYHWEYGKDDKGVVYGNDTLTANFEGSVPASEEAVFNQFSKNGFVPVFVFGCEYYRVGTQFEKQNDLNAERAEFERVIEEVLKEN